LNATANGMMKRTSISNRRKNDGDGVKLDRKPVSSAAYRVFAAFVRHELRRGPLSGPDQLRNEELAYGKANRDEEHYRDRSILHQIVFSHLNLRDRPESHESLRYETRNLGTNSIVSEAHMCVKAMLIAPRGS
jgi:hypothetical protein